MRVPASTRAPARERRARREIRPTPLEAAPRGAKGEEPSGRAAASEGDGELQPDEPLAFRRPRPLGTEVELERESGSGVPARPDRPGALAPHAGKVGLIAGDVEMVEESVGAK